MMKMINSCFKHLLVLGLLLILSHYSLQLLAAQNNEFGRLFSQPNERSHLDDLRQNQKLKIVTPQTAVEEPQNVAPVIPAEPVTLQGYVKRSDGTKSTLWINNQAVQEGGTVDNVQVGRLNQRKNTKGTQSAEGLELKMPGNGKRIHLKAGQMYEPDGNQIKELRLVEKERQLYLEETGTITDDNVDSRKSIE